MKGLEFKQLCKCGKPLPDSQSLHIYKCLCGRIWLRPDCSEACSEWQEY